MTETGASQGRAAVQALFDRVAAGLPGRKVLLDADRPVKLPPEGLVVVRWGDQGEPEELIGIRHYVWEHLALIEICVGGADPTIRRDTRTAILTEIGDALGQDPRLGGVVDYADVGDCDLTEESPEGAGDVACATVTVALAYQASRRI